MLSSKFIKLGRSLHLWKEYVSGRSTSLEGVHLWKEYNHRVESSLWKIILSKSFALINLSLNFCETTINYKVIIENLVLVL